MHLIKKAQPFAKVKINRLNMPLLPLDGANHLNSVNDLAGGS
jgi:hypothetical protein